MTILEIPELYKIYKAYVETVALANSRNDYPSLDHSHYNASNGLKHFSILFLGG